MEDCILGSLLTDGGLLGLVGIPVLVNRDLAIVRRDSLMVGSDLLWMSADLIERFLGMEAIGLLVLLQCKG
jgi:hypothetical protein